MSDESKNIFEKIYENLFMRDISYIFSGGFFLTIIIYALNFNFLNLFNIITNNFYSFILFILLSYFIGTFLYFLAPLCRVIPFEILKPKICADKLEIYTDIQNKYGNFAIKQLERVLFVRNFSSTISMAFLLGIILEIYHFITYKIMIDLIIIILFFLFSLFFIYIARTHHKSYESSLHTFGSKLISEK